MSGIKKESDIGALSARASYQQFFATIHELVDEPIDTNRVTAKETLEEDPEYQLILQCNAYINEIDDDIAATHYLVSELYKKKFPELESLVPNKVDLIRTIQRIGNEMDMTVVPLSDILSGNLIMILSVSASTTSGKPLSDAELAIVLRGCDEIVKLTSDKAVLLRFIANRMSKIAPNLCVVIGSNIAARLIGLAGGLLPLSRIPSCNLQVIGQEKKVLAGLSLQSTNPHAGILYQCDLVNNTPPALKKKLLKIVAAKVALLARIDAYQTSFEDAEGRRLRAEIESKVQLLTEPVLARTKRALPVPEEKKRNKRGGKRMRKMKERYAQSELSKLQNKMTFRADVGEYSDSAMGTDQGMVGLHESGHIRAPKLKKAHGLIAKKKAIQLSSGNSSGISSSLVFTPVQGLELVNPNAAADRVRDANQKWFSAHSGFMSALPKPH